jgi:hypothetical protein
MADELWRMSVPSTALLAGPVFTPLPRRRCELSFELEGPKGEPTNMRLWFDGVEAYKCTYLTSLGVEMIEAAYDRLVDRGATPWLAELSKRYESYWELHRVAPPGLRHLMVCFDDGPCYEFICTGYSCE